MVLAAVVAAISLIPLASTMTPAHAAISCPGGHVCLYPHANGGGDPVVLRAVGERYPDFGAFRFNDQMSSWQSNTSVVYCWYFHANYGHPTRVMLGHGPDRVINLTPDENDQASSLRPCD